MTEPKRRVLITGAGSGLGRGLAVALANEGHHIIAADINRAGLDETCAMLPTESGCDAFEIDVTSDASIDAFSAAVQSVDVLINNAGLQHVSPLEEFPMDKWTTLVDVMLTGTARLTRAVLPLMRKQGYGRIVNIGSIHSLVASPYKTAYVAAKHGLIGFSKVVALETGDVDVTINTICPAYIRTPLVESQIASQAKAHGLTQEQVVEQIFLKPMPKKQFISIDEVAGTIVFLMSSAAKNITAQAIALDGGWTAQ